VGPDMATCSRSFVSGSIVCISCGSTCSSRGRASWAWQQKRHSTRGSESPSDDQTMKSRSSKIMGGMWKRNVIANSVSVDFSGDRANVSTQPQSRIQCLCIGVFWIIMHKFTHIHRPSSPQGIGLQCPMPTNEARSNSARVADHPWPAKSPGRSITGGKERNRNGLKIAIFKQNPDQISIPHRRTHT